MSKTTQTKKNMRLVMAVIINSRKGENYNLKGLARSVWDVYAKHKVPDNYADFEYFYVAAKRIASYKSLVILKDPRADETIAQYAQRQMALDLAKATTKYTAAKEVFELFQKLGVKSGFTNFRSLLFSIMR